MLVYDEREERVTLHRKMVDAGLNNVDLGSEVVFQGSPTFQPLAAELGHFIDCVQSRQPPRSDGRQAVDVIRILEQVFPFTAP
jgi:predicted dehydrogenase